MDYAQKNLEDIKQRDQHKLQLASEAGITVVVVPFWWDRMADRYVSSSLPSPSPLFDTLPLRFRFSSKN